MNTLLAAILLSYVGEIAWESQTVRVCLYRAEGSAVHRVVLPKTYTCPLSVVLEPPAPSVTPTETEGNTSA